MSSLFAPKLVYGAGFSNTEGEKIIPALAANSMAGKAGLQYDDEVLSMNGIPLDELWYNNNFMEQITNSPRNMMILKISKADGTVRKVKLKKTNLFR